MNSESERETRRRKLQDAIELETGINEEMIRTLVHAFYARVRGDELIGPVFEARIADWAPHLERMCAFWSSVILMTGRYHGQPMQKHLPLPIEADHFDRWLQLFRETARHVCPPIAAEHFINKAENIAVSLELGIAGGRGILLKQGQRLKSAMK
jgi:hemoglobin